MRASLQVDSVALAVVFLLFIMFGSDDYFSDRVTTVGALRKEIDEQVNRYIVLKTIACSVLGLSVGTTFYLLKIDLPVRPSPRHPNTPSASTSHTITSSA